MTFSYNGGYLSQIAKPYCDNCPGTPALATFASFTYDSYGRVRTHTDSMSYVLTYDYDNLDRITKVTHPDQTFEKYEYSRLDLIRTWDRAGHHTSITYDDVGRPTDVNERLGRQTQ